VTDDNSIPEVPRSDESLPDRFTRIVQAIPNRPALASEGWNPSYHSLNVAVDSLAGAVLARGGNVGDRIALLMQHDTKQIAAMLAVLKAGRVVVVLNPSDAVTRLRLVVEDAAPAWILTDSHNAAVAAEVSNDLCTFECCENLDGFEKHPQTVAIDPQGTCYIVYTSGSSGRPKGVMLNHHQIMHNALRLSRAMELSTHSRVALLPSLSGLHGINNAWCALLRGACLLPFSIVDRGVTGLGEWMIDNQISAFSAPTSLFRVFIKSLKKESPLETVRMVRVGGELVTSEDFKAFCDHFHRDCILLNTLASSEAGNISSQRYAAGDHVEEGPLPVGRAFEAIEIIVADEDGRRARPALPGIRRRTRAALGRK
jgi:non-ribosomal peptide synthetase component F